MHLYKDFVVNLRINNHAFILGETKVWQKVQLYYSYLYLPNAQEDHQLTNYHFHIYMYHNWKSSIWIFVGVALYPRYWSSRPTDRQSKGYKYLFLLAKNDQTVTQVAWGSVSNSFRWENILSNDLLETNYQWVYTRLVWLLSYLLMQFMMVFWMVLACLFPCQSKIPYFM